MDDKEREGLSAQERAALAKLAASSEAPSGLEGTIVARLREMGEIRRARRFPLAGGRVAASIAAGLIVFAGGFYSGRLAQPPAESTPQERWLLLLRGVEGGSEAEHEEQAQAIGDWMQDWNRRGAQLEGEPLQSEQWFLAAGGKWTAADENSLEPASGYFFLEGADLERARAIGLSCPHLQMGGTIELRRVGM